MANIWLFFICDWFYSTLFDILYDWQCINETLMYLGSTLDFNWNQEKKHYLRAWIIRMCFTVLTMPHWSSSEQLPVLLRDKKDATLIYKKEICLYIFVTSGDQLICSIPLGYHWFYKLTYPLFKTNSWFSKWNALQYF